MAAADSETAAAASEVAAAASASTAASYAASLSSTSTTSTTIGTGAKTFTTQTNKQYTAGQFLVISSAANNANYMHGTVTSYSGTSLVMNITDTGGSGTLADWNISLSGTQGATGATGSGGISNGGYATNRYYFGFLANPSGSSAFSANTLYALPFVVGASETFTRIGVNVDTTGTSTAARLGIYNFVNGAPTTLVLDAGTVSTGTTGEKEVTISQALSAGVYALAMVTNGSVTLTTAVPNASTAFHYLGGEDASGTLVRGTTGSHTYGALPASYPSATYVGTIPILWFRKV